MDADTLDNGGVLSADASIGLTQKVLIFIIKK